MEGMGPFHPGEVPEYGYPCVEQARSMAARGLGGSGFGGHQQRHELDESRSHARMASGVVHASPDWRHYVWPLSVYEVSRDTKEAGFVP